MESRYVTLLFRKTRVNALREQLETQSVENVSNMKNALNLSKNLFLLRKFSIKFLNFCSIIFKLDSLKSCYAMENTNIFLM